MSRNDGRLSRRSFVGLLSGAAMGGLAGCFGGGGDGDPTTDAGPDPTDAPTDEATTTSTPTATTTTGADETVEMRDNRVFRPQAVTIEPGDTVVWENVSSTSHTVTAYADGVPESSAYFASGGFESETAARDDWDGAGDGAIAPGETYRHTFDRRGFYEYFCIPHEGAEMVGFVEVGNPTATPTATDN